MTTPPQTYDELVAELQRRRPSLSPTHRRIAQHVLGDPEAVAFMTISELASAADVNEATVVRFASSLGLKGYPGLAELCRRRLREQAQLLHRYDRLDKHESRGEELLQRAADADRANIARTASRITAETWDAAVAALSDAPRVHVLGLRKCHAPAYLLGYLLRMVREDVETVTLGAATLVDDLRRVHEDDCFVALSIHRYSTETVRAARWARERGAHCVAVTDNPGSPLAVTADEAFFVDVAGPSVLRSVTALTSLVQALAAGVAQTRGHDARETLLEEENLLREFGVYASDE